MFCDIQSCNGSLVLELVCCSGRMADVLNGTGRWCGLCHHERIVLLNDVCEGKWLWLGEQQI
jgi:hypothetical protein